MYLLFHHLPIVLKKNNTSAYFLFNSSICYLYKKNLEREQMLNSTYMEHSFLSLSNFLKYRTLRAFVIFSILNLPHKKVPTKSPPGGLFAF